MKKPCSLCRTLRTVALSVLLGAAAGLAVLHYGGSRELSMTATFFGALGPLLWWARRRRVSPRGPQ